MGVVSGFVSTHLDGKLLGNMFYLLPAVAIQLQVPALELCNDWMSTHPKTSCGTVPRQNARAVANTAAAGCV